MRLRTYILSLMTVSAIYYVTIKVFPDKYADITSPDTYVVKGDMKIPNTAIIDDGENGYFVWKKTEKCKAVKSNISLSAIDIDSAIFISGLQENDEILTFSHNMINVTRE